MYPQEILCTKPHRIQAHKNKLRYTVLHTADTHCS